MSRSPLAVTATTPRSVSPTTFPLPAGSAPEQLHLTWGRDPATDVTISWAAPGSIHMPAPTLAYSTRSITAANPGTTIWLPQPEPLDVAEHHPKASSVSFTDGLNGQTTYHYHVELHDLEPDTSYYYQVSDGASPAANTVSASFRTAPRGRQKFRFTSFGDLATPSRARNDSGHQWYNASDNAWYAVEAIENPGDGNGPPLFHLLNGDLCYANLNYPNAPGVWRDFGVNISRSAANRPWMPALGNHETEFGVCDQAGREDQAEGGIAAQGAAGNYWNGPYGYGHYLSRFRLPDNGVKNHDGNHLRGNFYAFQVGTVLFISLDADDVIYQDSGAGYVSSTADAEPMTTSSGASIPNGNATYNRCYTGDLQIEASDNSARPDFANGRPNLQTLWLERTLSAARNHDDIDTIVVFMHQCALSSAMANGSDLGIRQAWLPLFDEYEVDLVLSGHEHNFERSYPIRGYDAGYRGTVTFPNKGQTRGEPVSTRRPHVVTREPTQHDGETAWDTKEGTVFLVLGGGGNDGPSNLHGTDPVTGHPRAKVHTQRNAIVGSQATGFTRSGADSREDALWSASVNEDDAYGYAVFDVDPGERPGDTTITFQYFAIPAVRNESGVPHIGTTTLPTTPYERFVFGRGISRRDAGHRETSPVTATA